MVKTLPIILFVALFSSREIDDKKCLLPTSGVYDVVYDKAFSSHFPFVLTFNDGYCWINYDQDSTRYDIQNIDKCEWEFQNNAAVDTSKLPEMNKVLYRMGTPYYKVTLINKRKLRFVLHRNPHIIINSGYFQKRL